MTIFLGEQGASQAPNVNKPALQGQVGVCGVTDEGIEQMS